MILAIANVLSLLPSRHLTNHSKCPYCGQARTGRRLTVGNQQCKTCASRRRGPPGRRKHFDSNTLRHICPPVPVAGQSRRARDCHAGVPFWQGGAGKGRVACCFSLCEHGGRSYHETASGRQGAASAMPGLAPSHSDSPKTTWVSSAWPNTPAEWRNGRRWGLKIPCPQGRVGSTPTSAIDLN